MVWYYRISLSLTRPVLMTGCTQRKTFSSVDSNYLWAGQIPAIWPLPPRKINVLWTFVERLLKARELSSRALNEPLKPPIFVNKKSLKEHSTNVHECLKQTWNTPFRYPVYILGSMPYMQCTESLTCLIKLVFKNPLY